MTKPIHTASGRARDRPPTPLKGAKLSPDPALGTITLSLACSKVRSTGGGGGGRPQPQAVSQGTPSPPPHDTSHSQFLRAHLPCCEQDPFLPGGLKDGKNHSASPCATILSNQHQSRVPDVSFSSHPQKPQGACVRRQQSQSSLSILDTGSGAPGALSMPSLRLSLPP